MQCLAKTTYHTKTTKGIPILVPLVKISKERGKFYTR